MSRRPIPFAVLSWISAGALLLVACASHKDRVLPQDGPSMKAIYEAHFDKLRGHDVDGARATLATRRVEPGQLDLAGYTREAHDEIETRFARLPNPTLVMFVFPHLAGREGVPVPGYATTFPTYERVEYALPGEIPVFEE